MQTQANQVALPLRSDTILGVCEAIGQDFGFNPNFLRIPLAASVMLSPLWAFGIYFALGFVVLASRLLAPQATTTAAADVQRYESAANDSDEVKAAA